MANPTNPFDTTWDQTSQAFGNYFLNQNPFAGVSKQLSQQGQNPYTGYGQYAMGMAPSLFSGYSAAALQDPNLNFGSYLSQQQPQMQNAWATNPYRARSFTGTLRRILGS